MERKAVSDPAEHEQTRSRFVRRTSAPTLLSTCQLAAHSLFCALAATADHRFFKNLLDWHLLHGVVRLEQCIPARANVNGSLSLIVAL